MKQANPTRQKLTALGLLGIPLLNFPLVGLATGECLGLPAAYIYLFAIWCGLIAIAARVAERKGK